MNPLLAAVGCFVLYFLGYRFYAKFLAERIYSLVERLGVKPEFAVTGGMAKNRGVMDRLMPVIGLERMQTEWDTQIAGAVGAALFGYALCRKGKGRKK